MKNDQYPIGGGEAKYPIGKNDQYPIGGGEAKYPIGGDAKYPIGGGDANNKKELNNSNNMDRKIPKCVKCYNVVLQDSDIATKSLILSKYFSQKTYMDNHTALEKELHRYSFMPPIPDFIKKTKKIDDDILAKILKK